MVYLSLTWEACGIDCLGAANEGRRLNAGWDGEQR